MGRGHKNGRKQSERIGKGRGREGSVEKVGTGTENNDLISLFLTLLKKTLIVLGQELILKDIFTTLKKRI